MGISQRKSLCGHQSGHIAFALYNLEHQMFNKYSIVLLATVLIILLLAMYLSGFDSSQWQDILLTESNTSLFIAFLFLLPILGFPFSVACFLAGSKFGPLWGSIIVSAAILVHLSVHYYALHSFIKPWAIKWLNKYSESTLEKRLPSNPYTLISTIALIPVLPYFIKNLAIASTDINFRTYLLILLPIQILFAIPFTTAAGFLVSGSHYFWIPVFLLVLISLYKYWYRYKVS